MEGRVKGTLKEVEEKGNREKGKRGKTGWWDEKCREKKRKVRRRLREWRRRGIV